MCREDEFIEVSGESRGYPTRYISCPISHLSNNELLHSNPQYRIHILCDLNILFFCETAKILLPFNSPHPNGLPSRQMHVYCLRQEF